jgi:type IV secretion system protein VirB5
LIISVFLAISLCIVWYCASLEKQVPLIITVAPWGEARYIGDAAALSYRNAEIPEEAIQFQIREFVTRFRGISSDSEVLYQNIIKCYSMVTSSCSSKMTSHLREEDPFSFVGKTKRAITIESVLRLSDKTWQVDWIEKSSGSGTSSAKRIRGVFTVRLLEPGAKQRVQNPLGIYIDDYDYTEL